MPSLWLVGFWGLEMTETKHDGFSRIYVCHTFYHAYVACLKELNIHDETRGDATLVLSKMSNRFEDLPQRAMECGIFASVMEFDEKDYTYFEELLPLKEDTGSLPRNMWNRMKFCKRLGELEASFVPVDFRSYKDIYVFCDSDPIGYYLAAHKIRYHAVEDGLDCIRYRDTAVEDNKGHFAFKAWMAKMGFIFIQNGYSKYCIDMEVNDLSVLDHPIPKMVEVPREELIGRLNEQDRQRLVSMFIANLGELQEKLRMAAEKKLPLTLILSEPLCQDLAVRKKLFQDMILEYGTIEGKPSQVVIKPHPRDLLDYETEFPQHLVLDSHFPMEILNLIGAQFDRVVTVYTVPTSIHCAAEKIYLGNEFMDRYEDPALHAKVKNAQKKVIR